MRMENVFQRISAEVDDYDIIVIGHLKWNRYFGEHQNNPPRGDPSTCTSTLVRGAQRDGTPFRLLVDPTLRHTPADFYFDLNRRTGLRETDITHCFCTHQHADHCKAMNYFPAAEWLAAPATVRELQNGSNVDASRVRAVQGEFFDGVFAVALPGHTNSLHGVAFVHGGKRVVVAGDSVMTKHHYRDETTEYTKDPDTAAQTIRWLKAQADIVIAGHDGMIVNWPARRGT